MNNGQLSIVIPCKNEENFIGKSLQSLKRQTIMNRHIPIYIADANSTDGTRQVIQSYMPQLNIRLVDGGLPPVGKNNGARFCHSKYILFMDADIELGDVGSLEKMLRVAEEKQLELVIPNIKVIQNDIGAKIFETLYYWAGKTKLVGSFGGMLMLIKSDTFNHLGRFNENLPLGDDWELTHKIPPGHFQMADVPAYTSNRRFASQGYLSTLYQWILIAFSKHYRNKGHLEYFKKTGGTR